MVNREELINELQQYGNVILCDSFQDDISYVIVVDNWSGTIEDFDNIINNYLQDYPLIISETMVNQLIKCERQKN